jgi:hypothetical protein
MKKLMLLIPMILTGLTAFSQSFAKSGETCANTILFDSGGVSVTVQESKVENPVCSSNKNKKVCIFKCEFAIRNLLTIPVTLTNYDFLTSNYDASLAMDRYCDPKDYGDIEKSNTNEYLAAKSTTTIIIYGETPFSDNPTCCYKWVFGGFTAQNMAGK